MINCEVLGHSVSFWMNSLMDSTFLELCNKGKKSLCFLGKVAHIRAPLPFRSWELLLGKNNRHKHDREKALSEAFCVMGLYGFTLEHLQLYMWRSSIS